MGKQYHVTLTETEQQTLRELIGRRNGQALEVKRAYILLAADENGELQWRDAQIVQAYQVSRRTVERTRQRFVEEGFEIAVHGQTKQFQGV